MWGGGAGLAGYPGALCVVAVGLQRKVSTQHTHYAYLNQRAHAFRNVLQQPTRQNRRSGLIFPLLLASASGLKGHVVTPESAAWVPVLTPERGLRSKSCGQLLCTWGSTHQRCRCQSSNASHTGPSFTELEAANTRACTGWRVLGTRASQSRLRVYASAV